MAKLRPGIENFHTSQKMIWYIIVEWLEQITLLQGF